MSKAGTGFLVGLAILAVIGYAAYDYGLIDRVLREAGLVSGDTSRASGGPMGRSSATPVVVAPVVEETFADRLEAIGTLAANEAIVVTASVTGKIREINFDDGDRVEAGAVLVAIDDDEQRAQLAVQLAELEEQRKQLERIEGLAKTSAASQSRLDEQIANVRRAEANVDAARARLRDYTIQAPFSGLLGTRQVSIGALVSPGTQITTLDDISVLKLDFSVPESFISILQEGMSIEATSAAFPGETFTGMVQSVGSRVDPETRAIAVRARIPNDSLRLRPGMLMLVELLKNPRMSLMIPEQALVPRDNLQFVLRVKDDMTVELSQISIGRRKPGSVEVTEGLEEGDIVVIEGTTRARPGSEVKIMNAQTPPAGGAARPSQG